MNEYALIVAGGSGSRMQSETPKQFIKIGELPILMHTLNAFYQYSNNLRIILVLPEKQISQWQRLVEDHNFTIDHILTIGGATRSESVKNGLKMIKGEGLVAIHDGVRPFVTQKIINNCFLSAKENGTGVAAVTPKDSIRETMTTGNRNVDRGRYKLIQTPQTFRISIIKDAYASGKNLSFTDDASVAEHSGNKITLVEGDYKNIKITTPEDLKISQALLEELSK
jgi:2-C-methyl-D-erythritol 4-phosphate cytidylyltransferase